MVVSRRTFAQNGKEMCRNKKKAREGRAKFLFLFMKYANLWLVAASVDLKLPTTLACAMLKTPVGKLYPSLDWDVHSGEVRVKRTNLWYSLKSNYSQLPFPSF